MSLFNSLGSNYNLGFVLEALFSGNNSEAKKDLTNYLGNKIQNTLGYPCNIEEVKLICEQKKITLIEDLAHSIGTTYNNGVESGTMGDMTILSFSQDKIIDGISGGALITNHKIEKNFLNLNS